MQLEGRAEPRKSSADGTGEPVNIEHSEKIDLVSADCGDVKPGYLRGQPISEATLRPMLIAAGGRRQAVTDRRNGEPGESGLATRFIFAR